MFGWYSEGGWLWNFPPVAPCRDLWLLWIHALLHNNLQELLWSHLHTFTFEYYWFWKPQDAAVNPLSMVGNLEEVVVKPFAHFSNSILMLLESAGGCCEYINNVLESLEGCCEDICTFCLGSYKETLLAASHSGSVLNYFMSNLRVRITLRSSLGFSAGRS